MIVGKSFELLFVETKPKINPPPPLWIKCPNTLKHNLLGYINMKAWTFNSLLYFTHKNWIWIQKFQFYRVLMDNIKWNKLFLPSFFLLLVCGTKKQYPPQIPQQVPGLIRKHLKVKNVNSEFSCLDCQIIFGEEVLRQNVTHISTLVTNTHFWNKIVHCRRQTCLSYPGRGS